jgi:ABC-type uncharacterized transport system involved in gliding motility auxiliary subunit
MFSAVGVAAMFIITIALYMILGVSKQRIDLTADKVFTLSEGTRTILKKLDTPIVIRFYCTQNSSTMPVFLKSHAQRIEDLLQEYRKASKNMIEIKKLDPQPDSDAEDSANLDGVEGQMISMNEKVYLGVAVSCLDVKVALPFLTPDRERQLEYDLSRAISQVVQPVKPVIGVMSALPVFGQMNPMMMQMGQQGRQEPWVFISELKKDFTMKQVEMTADKIDDDIKVLLAVYPRDISEKTEYALDQFVLRGGKLIAFLDPLAIMDAKNSQGNPMQRNINSGASLDRLLKAWGIEFDKNKVVADLRYVTQINRGNRPEGAPAVLSLTQEAMDTNDVVTSQMDSLLLPFSGVFAGTPAAGLKRSVLLKTSTDSQSIEKMMAEFSGEGITKDFKASGQQQALAIRLTGKFKTAFPDGKPKDAPAKPGDKPEEKKDTEVALKESTTDGAVVLVGDSDMLYDQFCVRVGNFLGQRIVNPINQNLNLVQGLVEQMGGDQNLIGVRSRATMNRPFTKVKQMQAKAEERFRSKIKELEDRLADTQQKLSQMQAKKEGNQRFILSPEQQTAIAKFKQDQASVNKELKEVRKDLRKEIDSLETTLKWVNIGLMPFFVTSVGLGLAIFKRKRTAAK